MDEAKVDSLAIRDFLRYQIVHESYRLLDIMIGCDGRVRLAYAILLEPFVDGDEIGVGQDFLVLVIAAQYGVVQLKIADHPDNTQLLRFRLCQGSMEVFFEDLEMLLDKSLVRLYKNTLPEINSTKSVPPEFAYTLTKMGFVQFCKSNMGGLFRLDVSKLEETDGCCRFYQMFMTA